MAFTDDQTRELRSKLKHAHVRKRRAQGQELSYISGWHAISEANRIFGFDSWDRHTQAPTCLWSELRQGQTACLYTAKVRVTVRAGATITVREGTGTGFGRASEADRAHEIAIKSAETDATKRALATFGNPFGLALYDGDLTHVTRPAGRRRPKRQRVLSLSLKRPGADEAIYASSEVFVSAAEATIRELSSTHDVYAFWSQNLESLIELKDVDPDSLDRVIAALRARAMEVLRDRRAQNPRQTRDTTKPKQDAQVELAFPKEKRRRDKDHLRFVAKQPCVICGRTPCHAHHLKFAQPRAMSRKVSDEFTVPLCRAHHDELHRVGDERTWWARNGIIDPLKIADKLWRASRAVSRTDGDEVLTSGMNGSGSKDATAGAETSTSREQVRTN